MVPAPICPVYPALAGTCKRYQFPLFGRVFAHAALSARLLNMAKHLNMGRRAGLTRAARRQRMWKV